MWLTAQLKKAGSLRLGRGLVQAGEGFRVQGEREFSAPEQVAPYGVSSRAAGGKEAVMLEGLCAGVLSGGDSRLQAGEVRLYSAGGAEILLKNNGDVVVNGQVFPKNTEG